ncbi:hypothetical protein HMPREF1624_05391 [Sporothrix schenckii ATCC 58251]|uniref:G-patch domain-containing protein n=1 Tax=Sporothrix schenckii (strain ATCC 58251 / de Perez 2211183) TaxID=1391915 RepID=U7PV28_SPOS1|nr:hypothetical protein HMPREF1624_05391 [Sporothrix schenckii ATCC 58251]
MADEEDDYMTMTFGGDEDIGGTKKKHAAETSLQRRIRLEREGRERGRIPSKAELAKAAEAEREAALSQSLFGTPPPRHVGAQKATTSTSTSTTPAPASKWPLAPALAQPPKPVSKGFAMMAKMGFVAGQSLGKRREESSGEAGTESGDGSNGDTDQDRPVTEPIRIQVKRDRAGIGAEEERRKETEREAKSAQGDGPDAKRLRLDDMDPLAYRDRLRQEREAGRLERQIHAAQIVAERMARGDDENEDEAKAQDEMPLSAVNVLWRGMVKERRAKEHDREQRIKAQKLLDDRLRSMVHGDKEKTAKYEAFEQDNASDDDDDGNDRLARGQGPDKLSYLKGSMNTSISVDGDKDDEDEVDDDNEGDKDEELEEFNALEPQERLQAVVDWMRQNRRYCFWCKFKYPDDDLDGCPGPTEEDHD